MSPLRGIALKLIAVFLFSIMAVLIKAGSAFVPAGEAVFFRSFFAMPIILIWLFLRGDLRTGLKAQNLAGHAWRGFIGGTAMGFGFAALALLPLPEVTALGYAAPLLTVVFASVLLGERLRAFRITTVLIGLVGVVVILWPRLTLDDLSDAALWGVGLILASAVFRALAQIQIRRLVATEETSAIVFYFSLTATLFSLLSLPFGWVMPPFHAFVMLASAGLVGGLAQIFLTSSYKFAEASVVAPFDYASILFAILFGVVFFDEWPTLPIILGSLIVMSAGVMIVWRERQLGLKRGKARPGMTPQG
ncbi:MAG: DMT family transporter [Pelagimonas sp.]|jgi:drug/metabolite transporter (DMT)-like permease|nr:DMT family transporter [Pelagimonas sp.]